MSERRGREPPAAAPASAAATLTPLGQRSIPAGGSRLVRAEPNVAQSAIVRADERLALLAGLLACTVGVVVLVGWAAGLELLRSFLPGALPMKANAALLLVLSGTALALRGSGRRTRVEDALAIGVLGIATATALEFATGADFGIDRLLVSDVAQPGAPYAGRMALGAVIGFEATGLALLAIGRSWRGWHPSAFFAGLAGLVGGLGILGYLYGANDLTSIGSVTQISFPTVLGLAILAGGLVAADPEHGLMRMLRDPSLAGQLTRRLVPTIVLVLPVAGWLKIGMVQAGILDERVAVAAMVCLDILVLVGVGIWIAAGVERLDHARVAARRERDRLLETSENLIAITDPAGRLTLVSPSWTRTLGYGPDELLGHMLAEFIHPDDLASDGAAFLAAVNHVGRVNGLVNRGRARDGTYRWLEWNGTRDPETGQLYASALDITEHRRADLALLQSEGWYRTLADSLPHLVWTCRADGPCDYLSPRWVAYTGVPESEQLGYGWLEQLHPDDRDRVIAEWAAVAARGESFDIEFRIRRADGVFRWFKTRAIPFRDNDGQLVKWFGSNTDIDDSKRGEQELRELNAELDGRVTQRTIALEAANRELEAFSYSVSHDLRAPLRSIDAFSQILLNEYAAPLDAEGRRILGIVLRNVKQMGALIDDLLAFARVTRKELDRRHVDMTSLARSVADELRAVEPDRAIVIDIGSLVDAPGDGALLRQVWANLLGNAVKFSRPVEAPRVEVRSDQLDGEYRYTVRDNGVGFDPTYVDKLFKPFSRLHPTAEFEGTGIGLAIVARIVGRHGGRVWAEGTPGTGATFGFALPAEREAP